MADPVRILIARLSALGDVVHGLPVLAAVRARYPSAFVGWVVEERPASPLLVGHPMLDAVHVVPRKWLKSPRAVLRLRRELRAARYDATLDLQGLSKSAVAAWLSSARWRIGLSAPDAGELAPFLNNILVNPDAPDGRVPAGLADKLAAAARPRADTEKQDDAAGLPAGIRTRSRRLTAATAVPFLPDDMAPAATPVHVVDRTLAALTPLGIGRPDVQFPLPPFADEDDAARAWLDARGLTAPVGPGGRRRAFVAVVPGAGWPSKLWPPERFGEVAARLYADRGWPTVVVWGGAAEEAMADAIVARAEALAKEYGADSPERAAFKAPRTTIPELAALLRRAGICVGSDTGPLHLAVAAGVPSVGLFGPMPAERNGPYGPGHVSVQKRRMAGNRRERRRAGPEAMLAIAPDDVLTACAAIWPATS